MSGLLISAPYPEGAAMALATAAEAAGRLDALVMPSRGLSRVASRGARALGRGDAAGRLARGAVGVRALVEVAPWFEPLRLAGGTPVAGRFAPDVHALKAAFDARVARRRIDSSVVVAMPEAALATFTRHAGLLRVFHEVDGHPRARNEVLAALFGAARAVGESHPAAVLDRIEQELALADVVLSPSAAVSAQLVRHGVPAAKLVESHLGVDLAAFASPTPVPRGADAPEVLYVGQISLRKGVPFLLDAARSSGVRVRLIGPVVDPAILEGAPPSVRYDGVVSHAGVAQAMQRADAFVLPTLEDAFGLVVVEAAACGLPVITTPEAGAAEALGPQDLVSVPIGDAAALADALRAVEPLAFDDRAARAARIRSAAAGGGLNDWAAWTGAVLTGIDRRLQG